MAQINHILGVWESLQSEHIAVDRNRCVLVRNKNASCLKCADACTSDCISVDGNGQLTLNVERCIGCGTCTTACPTGALTPLHPTDRELFEACTTAMQAADGRVAIVCADVLKAAEGLYDPARVVSVSCLGRVDESLIVLLVRAGAKRIVLTEGACEGCHVNPGSSRARNVCETAEALLKVWGAQTHLEIGRKIPTFAKRKDDPSFDEGRRAFLADMIGGARDVARASADVAVREALDLHDGGEDELTFRKVGDDGTLPHALPNRRNRLLKGLASLGQPEDVMIGTRLWGHVIIDTQNCDSCRMCATFCPTGAIRKFDESDTVLGVDHFPARCVKCRCCADICPKGAISISEEVFATDLAENAYERYEMNPRAVRLGPHQMFESYKKLLDFDYIYER